MDATAGSQLLLVCDEPKAAAAMEGEIAVLKDGERCLAVSASGEGVSLKLVEGGQVRLEVAPAKATRQFKVTLWNGPAAALPRFQAAAKAPAKRVDFAALTKGGPARWTTPVTTQGKLGTGNEPYVVDTLTVPETNPWNSWIRCGGFDFFKDGRVALCSVSGDVWVISGIDATLGKLTWKRYATGLFQPLGLKIVDEKVYVLGRDQITRLHDLNGDGEADYYECFNNDVAIGAHYHEFALNLETDSRGNFYFIKGGNLGEASHPHHGCLLRVSKDGSRLDVVATGHRAPNGLSVGPHDEITTSDNEGNWVPSSRVNWIAPGGFYGHVFTAHRDPEPTDYDRPLLWLPHQMDNSSGGQVWVTSDRWGPFQGGLLHSSYGKCDLFSVLYEKVDGQMQGAAVKFPLKFDTGIMRGRFSPRDGQLYAAGLRVWQSSGAREGAFQRVRYTGKPVHLPQAFHVKKNGLEITFTAPLDPETARDAQNYSVDEWNYKWAKEYGSKLYSVHDAEKALGDKGQAVYRGEEVEIKTITLSPDKRTVFLELAEVRPVMQMRIRYNIDAADGTGMRQEIYNTINALPAR
jgi:glucose/arabinose dehydrogenase